MDTPNPFLDGEISEIDGFSQVKLTAQSSNALKSGLVLLFFIPLIVVMISIIDTILNPPMNPAYRLLAMCLAVVIFNCMFLVVYFNFKKRFYILTEEAKSKLEKIFQ